MAILARNDLAPPAFSDKVLAGMSQELKTQEEDMIKREKFAALVGKTIAGVVVQVSTDGKSPVSQVYLEFTDGTMAEFYSNSPIAPTPLVPWGREVLQGNLRTRSGEFYETPKK